MHHWLLFVNEDNGLRSEAVEWQGFVADIKNEDCAVFGTLGTSCQTFSFLPFGYGERLPPLLPCEQYTSKMGILCCVLPCANINVCQVDVLFTGVVASNVCQVLADRI